MEEKNGMNGNGKKARKEAAKLEKLSLERKVVAEGKMETAAPANAMKNIVLLIEDDESFSLTLRAGLRIIGRFEVVPVDNFEDAETELKNLKGQLAGVVTDIFFPQNKNETEIKPFGLKIVKKVKETMPDVPIVAQSSSNVALKMAKQLGADVTLSKSKLRIMDMLSALMPETEQNNKTNGRW